MNIALVIPAYEPDVRFAELVSEIQKLGLTRILVVDDGSEDCLPFEGLPASVRIDRHPINRGKGAALKTGMAAVVQAWPESLGVITLDADWQHLPEDVLRVAKAFEADPEAIVLGVRRLRPGQTPWKSLVGNAVIKLLARGLISTPLIDTQTGLRAIPFGLLPRICELPSNGYEFEMECLLALRDQPVRQVQIQTVYHDGNRKSNFKPLTDSLRILLVLVRWWFR